LQSRMVKGLAAPLLYVLGLSTAICACHQAAEVRQGQGTLWRW